MSTYDFPSNHYPMLIEFFHPDTRVVVHTIHVDAPGQQRQTVNIPDLRALYGHPVCVRVTFGTVGVVESDQHGTIQEP